MRPRTLALALLAATVLVAGCGDDDTDASREADPEVTETTEGTNGSDKETSLDEDVAALVGDEEISAATIDDHVADLTADPRFAEQLQGPQADVVRDELRAQILSGVIQATVVAASADAIDAPVTDEDVAAARAQVEEQAGGPEALQAAIEQQGLTEDLLEMELRTVAAVQNITEVLDEQAGDGDSTEPAPERPGGEELSPSEQRVQDFLLERADEVDIEVHPDFGEWDPEAGQVIPPGAATEPMPGG